MKRKTGKRNSMQVEGLRKRISVIGGKMVVGVSGGLDSTLALLVCGEVCRRMGKPMTDVVGVTMPCFGTTDRTYNNSLDLMRTLGITTMEIPIADSCRQHMKDIGHNEEVHDITYENVQARERTQVLMDVANKVGGIVVGTGDLSELALGWCTYNADHMSMYGVNASIPKTLIKWMIDAVAKNNIFKDSTATLEDIIDTPISPARTEAFPCQSRSRAFSPSIIPSVPAPPAWASALHWRRISIASCRITRCPSVWARSSHFLIIRKHGSTSCSMPS